MCEFFGLNGFEEIAYFQLDMMFLQELLALMHDVQVNFP